MSPKLPIPLLTIYLFSLILLRINSESISSQIASSKSKLKYNYPNWKKPLYSKRDEKERSISPKMNQHLMEIPLYTSENHLKVLNLVSRSKKEGGLKCGINSIYNQISFEKNFDHLEIEYNEKIIYSKLHSRYKILVYINDQVHIRIMDHIICLRLKYSVNEKGGCYQGFDYDNFNPQKIKNLNEIQSEIVVVSNNEVLTNYYLVLYIDKKIRIISKLIFFLIFRSFKQTRDSFLSNFNF